jgi:hypothetical protein
MQRTCSEASRSMGSARTCRCWRARPRAARGSPELALRQLEHALTTADVGRVSASALAAARKADVDQSSRRLRGPGLCGAAPAGGGTCAGDSPSSVVCVRRGRLLPPGLRTDGSPVSGTRCSAGGATPEWRWVSSRFRRDVTHVEIQRIGRARGSCRRLRARGVCGGRPYAGVALARETALRAAHINVPALGRVVTRSTAQPSVRRCDGSTSAHTVDKLPRYERRLVAIR